MDYLIQLRHLDEFRDLGHPMQELAEWHDYIIKYPNKFKSIINKHISHIAIPITPVLESNAFSDRISCPHCDEVFRAREFSTVIFGWPIRLRESLGPMLLVIHVRFAWFAFRPLLICPTTIVFV